MPFIENLNRTRELAGLQPLSEAQKSELTKSIENLQTLYITATTGHGDGPLVALEIPGLTDAQIKTIKAAKKYDLETAVLDLKLGSIDRASVIDIDTLNPNSDEWRSKSRHAMSKIKAYKKTVEWLADHTKLKL